MAKMHKMVDPNTQSGTSGTHSLTTDWKKCVLCQEDTYEMLICPSKSIIRGTQGVGIGP